MHRTMCAALAACALALVPAATASAASSYDDDTVIVKWRPGVSLAERLALSERAGVERTIATIHGIRSKVVQVSGDPAGVAAILDRSPLVEYAEPNMIVRASATPNDPMFGQLWGLDNTGQTGGTPDADIDAPEAWQAAGLGHFPSSGGVKVAVIDTGVTATHEDLVGKVVACATSLTSPAGVNVGGDPQPSPSGPTEGSCVDDHFVSHGTHVSGTITANANNGTGVTGVAFNSPLIACKALHGAYGLGLSSDVANCITWAHDKGAKVISMSLGGGANETQAAAARYAWENGGPGGSVLVAAAGNNGSDTEVSYPAGEPEVVSVAATDHNDQRASFSNANPDVEIAAPGVNVLSTTATLRYQSLSGTSMATPHVSGVAALIWTLNPGTTAAQVRAKLDASVDDLGPALRDPVFGFGRVNLLKAVTP